MTWLQLPEVNIKQIKHNVSSFQFPEQIIKVIKDLTLIINLIVLSFPIIRSASWIIAFL